MLRRILKVKRNVRKGVVSKEKKNSRPYTESRKESEEKRYKNRKKTLLGRLWLFGNGKTRLLFGRLWNAFIKWKWSTATTVPSPLSFTAVLTDEPLRTEHNLRRSVFENIFYNFFVIIGNGEFNHTGIKCLMWRCYFFFQLSFVFLSSQIMPHFVTKFVRETF